MISKLKRQWKWILAGLVVIGFLSSDGLRTFWQRKKALHTLEEKLEEIKVSNKNLTMEIDRLKNDPHAIEQVARKDLGLIQPGEIEYRFVVDHTEAKK